MAELRPEVTPAVVGDRRSGAGQAAGGSLPDRRRAWRPTFASRWGSPRALSTPTPAAAGGLARCRAASARPRAAIWSRVLVAAAVLVLARAGRHPLSAAHAAWPRFREHADGPATIAVLPLATRSDNLEDEYLGDGLSREIIDRLAQVEGLRVISPTSVVALKGRRLTVRQVADTLHVRHVPGRLARARRASASRPGCSSSMRSATACVWQQTYRLSEGQLLQLQDAIARQVAGALLTAGGGAPMPAAPRRTAQVAAYESYLKGVYWLERRTPEALRLAGAAFEEALAQDADYPQALAGLASAHTYAVIYGYRGEADPYSELAEALRLAGRAVARRHDGRRGLSRAGRRPVDRVPSRGFGAGGRGAGAPPQAQLGRHRHGLRLGPVPRGASSMPRWRRPAARLALDPLAPGLRHSLVALAIGARRYDVALREVRPALPGGARRSGLGHPSGLRPAALGSGGRVRRARSGPVGRACARCASTSWAGAPRPRPWPTRSAASSMRSATRSCTSTPTSRPTTPGGATRPSRCTGWSGRWPTRRCCTSGSSGPGCSTEVWTRSGVSGRVRASAGARPRNGSGPGGPPSESERHAAAAEFRCDVPTAELLAALATEPLAARPAVQRSNERRLYRDVYVDTSDNALATRGITCRIRYGADDRRTLTLGFAEPGLPGVRARARCSRRTPAEVDLARHSPRRQRARRAGSAALVDPRAARAALRARDRAHRARSPVAPWPLAGPVRVPVRPGDGAERRALAREFRELKVRRLRGGGPRLEELARALEQSARPSARAADQDGARARSCSGRWVARAWSGTSTSGRAVAVIALEEGRVAVLARRPGPSAARSRRARASTPCDMVWPNGSARRVADLVLRRARRRVDRAAEPRGVGGAAPSPRARARGTDTGSTGCRWWSSRAPCGPRSLRDPATQAAFGLAARSALVPEWAEAAELRRVAAARASRRRRPGGPARSAPEPARVQLARARRGGGRPHAAARAAPLHRDRERQPRRVLHVGGAPTRSSPRAEELLARQQCSIADVPRAARGAGLPAAALGGLGDDRPRGAAGALPARVLRGADAARDHDEPGPSVSPDPGAHPLARGRRCRARRPARATSPTSGFRPHCPGSCALEGGRDLVPIEDIVLANLALLYPDRTIEEAALFRVTRPGRSRARRRGRGRPAPGDRGRARPAGGEPGRAASSSSRGPRRCCATCWCRSSGSRAAPAAWASS